VLFDEKNRKQNLCGFVPLRYIIGFSYMLCNINLKNKPLKKVTGAYNFYSPKLQLPKETVRL
jgi:hypothetical protein